MAGTIAGGIKAAAKIKERDPDFYTRIGSKGGKNGNTGGFAQKVVCNCDEFPFEHTKPQCRGKIGGRVSKRTKVAA